MPITQQKLKKLREVTPKATIADITTEELANRPGITEHVSAYLSHYAAPKKDASGETRSGQPCVACDTTQSFTWGLAHGQGHCVRCGWPGTLYHFINDEAGQEVVTVRGVLLWLHPDEIVIRKRAS